MECFKPFAGQGVRRADRVGLTSRIEMQRRSRLALARYIRNHQLFGRGTLCFSSFVRSFVQIWFSGGGAEKAAEASKHDVNSAGRF